MAKTDNITTTIIVITLISLVGVAFIAGKGGKQEDNKPAASTTSLEIQVQENSHDWGEIGLNDGNVEKTFAISNDSEEILKLYDVVSSCMCTTAVLSKDGEVSPEFGMHTKSDYVMEVNPGETAELKVVFDPAFHGPSGVGPITRQIQVKTNSVETPVLNFTLTAMVRK